MLGVERSFEAVPVVPTKGTSLAAAVLDSLQAAIFNGVLKVGDRLPPERELAAQFGVSRPTVREALRTLELLDLLELRQGAAGGGIVAGGAETFWTRSLVLLVQSGGFSMSYLYDARKRLEPIGLTQVMEQCDGDTLGALVALLRGEPGENSREAQIIAQLKSFHHAIAASVPNTAFRMLVSSLVDATHIVNTQVYSGSYPPLSDLQVEHERVAVHIETGDAVGAARALEQHLQAVADYYRAQEREEEATTVAVAAT